MRQEDAEIQEAKQQLEQQKQAKKEAKKKKADDNAREVQTLLEDFTRRRNEYGAQWHCGEKKSGRKKITITTLRRVVRQLDKITHKDALKMQRGDLVAAVEKHFPPPPQPDPHPASHSAEECTGTTSMLQGHFAAMDISSDAGGSSAGAAKDDLPPPRSSAKRGRSSGSESRTPQSGHNKKKVDIKKSPEKEKRPPEPDENDSGNSISQAKTIL